MNISGFIWFISIVGYPLFLCDQIQYIKCFKRENEDTLKLFLRLVVILIIVIIINLIAIKRFGE